MKRLATAALAVLTVLVMVFTLTACGGKAVTLTVHDKDAKTEVEANVGMTVAQVLEKAEKSAMPRSPLSSATSPERSRW